MFYLRFESVWNLYFIVCMTSGSELNYILLGGNYELVDLTLGPLTNSTYVFDLPENGTSIQFPQIALTIAQDTHIESKYYVEHGMHISEQPIPKLMVQLIIIDVSSKVKNDPKYIFSIEDLYSSLNNEILSQISLWPSLIVIQFGWSKYYFKDPKKYVGYDKRTDSYNTPAISSEAVVWLTKCELCKNVIGIGTDLPSLYTVRSNGNGTIGTAAVRNTLSKASLYIIAGLFLNDSLPGTECIALLSRKNTYEANVSLMVVAICPKKLYNANNVQQKRQKREMKVLEHHIMSQHHKHEHMGCGHHMHKNEDGSKIQGSASSEGNDNEKKETLPQKIIQGSINKIKDKFNKILP